MRTYTRILTAASAATALTLAACGSSGGDSQSSDAGGSGSLVVGMDLTYPPYTYMDGDTPAGFDPDVWALLGPEMGVEYTIQDTRFEQLIPNLNSDHIDVISSALYITPERAEQVDYIPYFTTGNSIVSLTDGDVHPVTVTDLCGLTVAVIKGGDISAQLNDDGNAQCADAGLGSIQVNDFPTDPEGTQALLAGQVDAQVTDAAVAANVVEAQSGLEITSEELLYPVPVGMAVKKGNEELAAQIQAALDQLRESGAYQDLLDQYNLAEPTDEEVQAALGN